MMMIPLPYNHAISFSTICFEENDCDKSIQHPTTTSKKKAKNNARISTIALEI